MTSVKHEKELFTEISKQLFCIQWK